MDNNYNIEEIEQYIHGKMSDAEKKAFETKMNANEELRAEVDLYRDMMISIDMEGEDELRAKLKATRSKLEKDDFFKEENKQKSNIKIMTNNTKSKSGFSRYAIAATLLALVAAGIYLFNTSQQGDPMREGFAKFYKPESKMIKGKIGDLRSLGMASPNKGYQDSLAMALELYDSTEFEKARVLLDEILTKYPNVEDVTANFYMGLTLLEQGQYGKASKHLLPISERNDSPYFENAQWYLMLCYTMFNTSEGDSNAKKLLKIMADNSGHEYNDPAEQWLSW